jgi:hypothetical protein
MLPIPNQVCVCTLQSCAISIFPLSSPVCHIAHLVLHLKLQYKRVMLQFQEAAITVVSGASLTAINCTVDGWNGNGSVIKFRDRLVSSRIDFLAWRFKGQSRGWRLSKIRRLSNCELHPIWITQLWASGCSASRGVKEQKNWNSVPWCRSQSMW